MLSAAQMSCALVVFALIIGPATAVETHKSTHAGVALNTLHSIHFPAARKRRLRQLAPSFSNLKSISGAIYQIPPSWVWFLTQKSSDEVFMLLKLKKGTELFGDPNFVNDDAALAELLVAGSEIKGLKSIAGLAAELQAALLKKWDNEGKTVEEVLQILALTKGNPFQNSLILQLFAFVKLKYPKDPTLVMLTAFREIFKDDGAWAKLLVAATETKIVKSIASLAADLQAALLKKWDNEGKTVEEVLQILALTKGNPFQNSLILQLFAFVKLKYPKDPTLVMLTAFREIFKDDGAWAKLLVAATETKIVKSIASLAADLQVALLKKWNNEGKTVEEELQILELHKSKGNPFQDPLFLQLFAFVRLKHPKDHTAVTLTAFQKFYKDDSAWAKLLVAATETKIVKSIASLAADLQVALLKKWNEEGKTVEEVLQILELHKSKGNPFQDPLFLQFAWAKLLVAATETKSVKSIASFAADLQVALLNKWNEDGKTVEEVLQILELHKSEGNPFPDPLFLQLFAFVRLKHPKDHTAVMLTAFRKFYKDDGAWAKLLVAGTEDDSVKSIALNLLWLQLSRWTEGGKMVGELFTLVGLDKSGEGLFQNILFSQWATFIEVRHRNNPEAATDVIWSTLVAHYGEEGALANVLVTGTEISHMFKLAVSLLRIQVRMWYNQTEESVEWVFTILKLDEIGERLFDSPLFLQWVTLIKVRHRNNSEAVTDVIWSTLAAHYGEEGALADILVTGTKILHMAKLAVNLLKIQFRRWHDTGKSVEWLFTVLKLKEIEEELFESPRLFMWLVYAEKYYRAAYNEAYKAVTAAAKKSTHAVAKKRADEAAKTALTAATIAPFEAVFLTLRRHYNEGIVTRILANGSQNSDPEVKLVADALIKMF
ncbi:unnamed protein product [Peronospora farinosa]|uniref:RxLR effector PexRD54 WY domain-containing protein n=1 Tax=Peronospora farinosa TaxID=134698 RepID=A0ABN8BX10_9STRA|nr:unnamed protein product [Peronospora farinosa]